MPELEVIIFLMFAAFIAGWVDAIGGGGGLIQFPALLFGLPNATPAQLLGINKASSIFGTAGATTTYFKKMPLEIKATIPMAILARMTRSSMLEVLGQDYVRTAKGKGLRRFPVVLNTGIQRRICG